MSLLKIWSEGSEDITVSVLNILNIYTKFIKKSSIDIDYHFGEASVSNDMVSVF